LRLMASGVVASLFVWPAYNADLWKLLNVSPSETILKTPDDSSIEL
jgi:hypothetical protein